jgi:hypothetical protein
MQDEIVLVYCLDLALLEVHVSKLLREETDADISCL